MDGWYWVHSCLLSSSHIGNVVSWYFIEDLLVCVQVHSIVKLQCGFWNFGFWGLRVFGFAKKIKVVMKDGSGIYYETTLQNSETLESLQFWF